MQLQLDEMWEVRDLDLTPPKVAELWRVIQRHKTLFSDLTAGDVGNFIRCLLAPHTMWFEIRKRDVLVGLIWFGEMEYVVEANAHMAFFDRRPAEKREVCTKVVQWMFDTFPLQRITVMLPAPYTATNRLLVKMGFRFEGKKVGAVLLDKRWNDMLIFGMTRREAQTLDKEEATA